MVQPTLSGNSHPPTSPRHFCFFLSALSRFLVAWFCVAPMDKDWCARVEGGSWTKASIFFKRRKVTFWWKKIPGYAELHRNLPNVFFGLPTFERDHQLHQLPSIRSLYPTAHYATMHRISTSSSGCVNNTLFTAFNGDFVVSLYDTIPPKNRGVVPICKVGLTPHTRQWWGSKPTHWSTVICRWIQPIKHTPRLGKSSGSHLLLDLQNNRHTSNPSRKTKRTSSKKRSSSRFTRLSWLFIFCDVTRESSNFCKKKSWVHCWF